MAEIGLSYENQSRQPAVCIPGAAESELRVQGLGHATVRAVRWCPSPDLL
jgi:hypothetical protein